MGNEAPELEVIAKLFDFEKELGEIATSLQGWEDSELNIEKYEMARKGYYDLWVFKRGEEALREIKDYLERNKEALGKYYYDFGADIISNWIDYLESEINVKCAREHRWEHCDAFDGTVYRDFIEKLREKGIKCGFIGKGEEKVSFVRVLDSLRNCLHTMGIEMSKVIEESKGLERETKGICKVVRSGDMEDEVSEICRIFAEHVIKNTEHYAHEDRGKQSGIIYGDEVQFKLGSAAGHASVLDLKKGEFRYEDHNEVRLYAVKRALESMGLLCESRGSTLTCKGVDFEEAKKIARLLAFLPSLDLQVDDLIQFYVDMWMDGCIERCFETYGDEFREECEKEGWEDYFIEECISEKCKEEICTPELEEEAIKELKYITAEALENVVENEEFTYQDMMEYLSTEMGKLV